MKTDFSGILLVNKPQGITSHDVVFKVRKLYNTREVGHTGALDPVANGLVVALVGRGVKASALIVADHESCRAGLKLGLTTDTEDVTGEVLTKSDAIPTEQAVMDAVASFSGVIEQVPPMYSALKVEGKKLVDLARKGVTRKARSVEIFSIAAQKGEDACDYTLDGTCSKGTYIRTLCADIGAKLGCGGVMSSLTRVRSGAYTLDGAYTLEALGAMSEEERIAVLLPVEGVFYECPVVQLPAFYEKLAKNGCEIYQKKLKTSFPVGTRLRLYDSKGFYALGEVQEYPDGSAIKCVKFFAI